MLPDTSISDFEIAPADDAEGDLRLIVDLAGYEGPLDLMLELARHKKLDLHEISILALADQYLAFIHEARLLRLELAGDYLVMAAWLTYLKSRLLVPERVEDEAPAAQILVQDLAARLQKLDAIRKMGAMLGERYTQGHQSYPRGAAEAIIVERSMAWSLSLHDLVAAYAERRQATTRAHYQLAARKTLSIPDARAILERLIGQHADWCPIEVLMAAIAPQQADKRSAQASSFAAALELAREGRIALRQEGAFAPLYLRASPGGA